MKKRNSPTGGFTLVEIMIVVAIIGMLATMAIPQITRAREQARQTACINNLRVIEGAVHQWALALRKDGDQAVSYSDIQPYMKNSVVCPSGGTSFEDSYRVTTADEPPTCVRKGQTHKLPL
jgi:prepilin-type N-terminal cleavage/methylation domain-containing protein